MKILRHNKYSKEDLIKKLRKVTLLHSTNTSNPIYIYKNADIEIDYVTVSSIMPFQFYYLENVLSKLEEVNRAFTDFNIDLFDLDGSINYFTNESDSLYNLLPIIIEYQREKDGSINPMILDGVHRFLLAKRKNLKKIKAIKISNADKLYPVFGYVNPNGWYDVKPVESVPEKKYKRLWRFPVDEAYKYYRNFNSVFDNVGKPRK